MTARQTVIEKRVEISDLAEFQLICIVTRIGRRLLPLLVDDGSESRIKSVASMDYGLYVSEEFCRTGETMGCGISVYNGPSEPLRKISKAICDSISYRTALRHKLPRLVMGKWKATPYDHVQGIITNCFEALCALVSPQAANDFLREIERDAQELRSLGLLSSIDITAEGPLGPHWAFDKPGWQQYYIEGLKDVLEKHQNGIRNSIENARKRSSPEDLFEQYKLVFESIGYERLPDPCPYLEVIITAAYDASMQQEEGRPVRFQLQLQKQDTPISIPFRSAYTTKNLVKLSPVVGIGFRHLVVAPNAASSLEIVGISDLEISNEHLNSRTPWLPIQHFPTSVKEVDFRLKILGPGHVQISDNSMTWELRHGSIQYFQPLTTVKAIQGLFREGFGILNGSVNVPQFALCSIVQKMLSARHGGTIMVVDGPSDHIKPKFDLDVNVLRDAIQESMTMEAEFGGKVHAITAPDMVKCYSSTRTLTRAVDTIAALTFVDGAVVMNRNFGIIGFGAEIAYDSSSSVDEVECLARVVGVGHGILAVGKRKVSDFGMRHRSAYSFCKENPSSIAIVVSQDGGIRIFCTEANRGVVLYENITADTRSWGRMRIGENR